MADKPLLWVGSALNDLREFPPHARRLAGHELHLVQMGLAPSDWRPMASVGPGVVEIRIHSAEEHRVFPVARFAEGVYVLHAFQKTSRKTSRRDIDIGSARYREAVRHRHGAKEVFVSELKRSSGNVFKDLGFPAEEADHLKIRSSLMGHLRRLIEARDFSQVEAAKLLGITQPRVSDLVRGRIDLFSIDTLVDLLARIGVTVRLEVSSSTRRRSRVA